MLYEVKGNLLSGKYNVFVHQTNCKGVMGAGIAKSIASLYPSVRHANSQYCQNNPFGTILAIPVSANAICVNMYAQDGYGIGKRYTDYAAMRKCLNQLVKYLRTMPADWKVGFPSHIGCGLAGGDWNIVRGYIERFSHYIPQDVYIVSL